MDENIISWNVTNWVTIVLMAALGFAAFATIAQVVRHFIPTSSASSSSGD